MRRIAPFALRVAVAVLVSGNSLGLPHAAAERLQQPIFRAATQLIEIDVRVTDRDGRFRTGLSQDDFDVLEDGEPQRITQFSFVNVSTRGEQIEQPRGSTSVAKADRDAVAGRTYVMLLDGPAAAKNHVQRMRIVARLFLDHMFGPSDQMAVTFVKGKFLKHFEGHEQEMFEQSFTTDRRAIEAAVDRLAPDTRISTGAQGIIRTYEAIEDISNQLGASGGRRKTLVWIGGQVPFNPADEFGTKRWAAEIVSAYRKAIRAANRHNVAIYVVDLLGLTTRLSQPQAISIGLGGEELKRMAALRAVAEDTGGEAVVGTNNYAEMFAQIATQSNTYYLLGYQASVARCDGQFHAIAVRVKPAGASVRARRGYFAPEPPCADQNPGRTDRE